MARMIPSFFDDHAAPGERDVFNLLSSGPEEWVVLYSLDLAPWNRGLRTEIDFVVIVPDAGILCIEVKSHENIAFDGERWHPKTILRSPFKQASDGRYTFYRRLSELAPQFKRFPVVHCCIFPRASFILSPNLSIQPWELMDFQAFCKFNSSTTFCRDLQSRIKQSIAADVNLNHPDTQLSKDQVDYIIKCCVPVQKLCPDAREEISRREAEIDRILLEQQKPVLQLSTLNNRLVISGGAGTGKTLIAMEVARRWAESGSRVALLCYNKLIGDWMKQKIEQVTPALPNLIVGSTISVLAEMSGVKIPDNPSREFWEIELIQAIEERITDPVFKINASFDYLVIDEAQDVLARPRLWQCLTLFISGGIEKGSFSLFGDFEYQILTTRENINKALSDLNKSEHPVKWKLYENCRNYRIVGDTAVQLSGLSRSIYTGYLRSGGSIQDYDIYFYRNQKEQLEKLVHYIKEFKAKGYRQCEITILSFRADNLSAAMSLKKAGYKFQPAWQVGNSIHYATIHAFKGLENKIIILTDTILTDMEFNRDLFYTGMTRATESIRVLCAEDSQQTILKWLVQGDNS
jgi:hypothetical protein